MVTTEMFYICLGRISEASMTGWKVWNPHDAKEVPSKGELFVPLLVPNDANCSDWVLLAVEADRRWAKVYSASICSPGFREQVKSVISDLRLFDPVPKLIFAAPIYQDDTEIDNTLVLIVAACYRAAGYDVPDVVENLKAWRLVVKMIALDETGIPAANEVVRTHVSIEDQVVFLCKLAKDIRKSTRLVHDLAKFLADSDLPSTPIATCALIFSKLASNFDAPGETQNRLGRVADTLDKAEHYKGQSDNSAHEGLLSAMDGLLVALGAE